MSAKQSMKAFVRLDANYRVVPGSLIFRQKMPAIGRWFEIKTVPNAPVGPAAMVFNTSGAPQVINGTTVPTTDNIIVYGRLRVLADGALKYTVYRGDDSVIALDQLIADGATSNYLIPNDAVRIVVDVQAGE